MLVTTGGDKAVSFGTISRATGLAGATLVQRYGSRDGMVRAAWLEGWDRLDAALAAAEGEAPISPKGAQVLLKLLGQAMEDSFMAPPDLRDRICAQRAEDWRVRVESALSLRMGGKGREEVAILFAAWQGQMLWSRAGERAFRLKEAVKRLT
jgi:AcrR family transcriptional regulator